MPNDLHNSFNSIYPLTPEAWQAFSEIIEPMEVGENEFLVRAGERVKHCFALSEGIIRSYYTHEGKEYNKAFFVPGMFPTSLTAILTGTPSQFTFQALTPCKVIRIPFRRFRLLGRKHRSLDSLMLRVLEIVWIKKEQHDLDMEFNNVEKNYKNFRKAFPNLEEIIPQYHIASYLGISPMELSRIQAEFADSVH